jgi:D-alanyl-D-alanine carboxypeptidase
MKKWFFLLVFLMLSGCDAFQQNAEVVIATPSSEDNHSQGGAVSQENQKIKVAKDQVYQGNLILVNKDYSVHQEGIQSDVVNLFQHKELTAGYGLLNNNIHLSQNVAQAFLQMVHAAGKDKVRHFLISSGYRDSQEQNQLYQEMGSAYALPAGYSEHNTGLALDIGSSQAEMNQAPEGKWLQKYAWKYGFILRYPKDKAAITGIQYEPWHFRYVGLPHSAIMQKKDFTLEQYLDYVKEQKNITTTVDGKKYEIYYYPVSQTTTIKVPVNRRYEISGNNLDGVIVTVYPG